MEIFESIIENVSGMDIKVYEDLDKRTHNLEIWAKSGEKEYIYKFTGPGVKDANANLIAAVAKEKHRLLEIENENLKKELYFENGDQCVLINGKIYKIAQLMDRIQELEALKTPTIENFEDEKPSSRRDILKAAEKCVCGQREQDYGTPESNFQLIADLWNGYLGGKTDNPVISVTPMDVSMMMALLKIARIRNGGGSGDSFVDLAGYAACGGEIWYGRKKQVPEGE